MNMSVLTTIDKRVRLLYVVIVGMGLLVIGMLVGFISYINSNSANSATTPGTCLPIDKGGTGCDGEGLVSEYNISTKFIYTTTKQDTGRTTDDGYIIWGQKFAINITASAGVETYSVIRSNAGVNTKIISTDGNFNYGYISNVGVGEYVTPGLYSSIYYDGNTSSPNYNCLMLVTNSILDRTNAPVTAYVDWIDGAVR